MFTCGGSVHLNDAVRLFVHLPTVEGSTPHRHFYARHLKIKIKFRNCTHICTIRNRILNSIDQNCIQNFPECGWWFAFSAWFRRKCICFSIYFWVCSGPSSFHHFPVTVQSTDLVTDRLWWSCEFWLWIAYINGLRQIVRKSIQKTIWYKIYFMN